MDRSLGTAAQPRIQDVTPQILKSHTRYGSSDNTAAYGTSSGRCLHYAWGPSLQRSESSKITTLPFTFKFEDQAVGLFGAENYFFKVILDVPGSPIFEDIDPHYKAAPLLKDQKWKATDKYKKVAWDSTANPATDYEDPVKTDISLPPGWNGYVSVRLNNLKTGNIYVDDWLDTRLYTDSRMEHAYDLMYVGLRDFFYVGFHARNTKRLPYNVEVVIGEQFLKYDQIKDKRFIAKRL